LNFISIPNKSLYILLITSANFVKDRLPQNTIHRYFPLDHPLWVKRFLDSVNPSLAFWVESELWPNMLGEVKNRSISAILINGRMSEKSYKNWQKFPKTAKTITSCFDLITVQTENDGAYYSSLGAENVKITDNLKYSAKPLAFDRGESVKLKEQMGKRKIWLYSSTHDGEERLACKTHKELKKEFPNLLTIIAPRHPARTDEILSQIKTNHPELKIKIRKHYQDTDKIGEITQETDIYIVNTMGELGLFYYLSPIACIGRSFSNDGGGGHNPIEAAILDCAVLSGKNVCNFTQVYSEMEQCKAYIKLENKESLAENLMELMKNEQKLKEMKEKSRAFAEEKSGVAEKVMDIITPYIDRILTDHKI